VETLENPANSFGFDALGFIPGSAPKARLRRSFEREDR